MMEKSKIEILSYDLEKYNFPKIIGELISNGKLDKLMPEFDNELAEVGNSLYKNMERSKTYSRLYSALESNEGHRFYDTYYRFIAEVIRPFYSEGIYFQKKPTHRILYSDATGISRFHRDKDYGHNPDEINFFVPQTNAFDTNTLWIESEEGLGDFKPMELVPGQFLRFDGANLAHGAKINTTGKTRVSFDFRILPESLADKDLKFSSDHITGDLLKSIKDNPHTFELVR